jgi:hypothetical protein
MFAYGVNHTAYKYGDCEKEVGCPAKEAGEDQEYVKTESGFADMPSDQAPLHGPIAHYDGYVQDVEGKTCGVTNEETAKEAWFHAIMVAVDQYHRKEYVDLDVAERGVEIAKDLGWI